MRQFVKSIVLFSVVLMLLYPVLIFIWGASMPSFLKPNLNYCLGAYGHMNSRLKEVKEIKKVDVLIVGSSLAYRGLDTRIFSANGISSFNLGSSSQTPLQTKVLLIRYLDMIAPKMVIYVVDPDAFTSDGVESSLDVISNDKNDINSVKMALKVNHIKVYNTWIYALIRENLSMDKSFVEPRYKDDDTYIPGGYVEKKLAFFKKIKYKDQKWVFKQKQFKAFNDAVSFIKKRGIKLILVNPPITKSLYKSYENNHTFDSIMATSGNYYDFNGKVALDDSLNFYDQVHLNQLGVEKFDSLLILNCLKNFIK